MGSELYENEKHLWSGPWSIIRGDSDLLQLNIAGQSIKSIEAAEAAVKREG
jgi:hypothetical protein